MKRKIILSILLLLPIILVAQERQQLEDTARKFFNHLMNKEVAEMNQMFTEEFKKMVPAGQVGEIASGLESQLGKFSHIKRSLHTSAPPYEVITLVVEFGGIDYGLNISMDEEQKIAGFHINMAPPENFTTPPAYADSTLFSETSLTLDAGDIELPAMLSMPLGISEVPIVVLVHGSGPNDMDETIGPNKILRDIAHGLASKGIAVLRYDKRTFKHGQSLKLDSFTVKEEVIDDAVHAIHKAMQLSGIDTQQVYLAGHSLGGMMAPRIAQQVPELAGIISLAGSPRFLSDIIPQQIAHLNTIKNDQSQKAIENLELTRRFAAEMDSLRNIPQANYQNGLLGLPPSYWEDLNRNDLGEIAAALPQPMLIVQGGRDYQVNTADFNAWKEALSQHPDVSYRLFEDLNHLFFSGEGLSTPDEYFEMQNVDERVVKAMVEWINR